MHKVIFIETFKIYTPYLHTYQQTQSGYGLVYLNLNSYFLVIWCDPIK